MSMMWSTCSMSTGHCSTHAPQVVHDHSTSSSMIAPGPTGVYAASESPSYPCHRPAARRPRTGPPVPRDRGRPARQHARGHLVTVTVDLGQCLHVRRLGVGVVAQPHDEQLGRQRLLGVPRGALALAAAALGAGREVEQALPGEVLHPAHTERGALVELLHLVHGERLARDDELLGRAQRHRPPAEHHVDRATKMCRCLECSTKMRKTSMTPMCSSRPTCSRTVAVDSPSGSIAAPTACEAKAALP